MKVITLRLVLPCFRSELLKFLDMLGWAASYAAKNQKQSIPAHSPNRNVLNPTRWTIRNVLNPTQDVAS
jgi:hypothetical protein